MLVSELKVGLKRYGFDDKDPLLLWLNAGMHEIEEAEHQWSFLEEDEVGVISAGGDPDGRFNLKADAKRIGKVRDVTDELRGGNGYDLMYEPRRELQRKLRNLRFAGNPEYFTILGTSTLQVYPVPGADRTLETSYVRALTDLVLDAEEPPIPESYHYAIVLGAAYIALQAENEEDRAANAQAQFEAKLEKLILSDTKKQVGSYAGTIDTAGYNE